MPDREKVTIETFYRDHWIDVEPERFRRYTEMFAWSEASPPLLEPAGIGPGETVPAS